MSIQQLTHPTPAAAPTPEGVAPVRPGRGSRAERLAEPLGLHAIKALAIRHGVCVRPVALRLTDLASGRTEIFDLPCGATRDNRCPPCAKRAKKLREHQCREGWHRDDEPLPEPEASPEQVALLHTRAHLEYVRADCLARAEWHHIADIDAGIAEVEQLLRATGIRGQITPPAPEAEHTRAIAATTAGAGAASNLTDAEIGTTEPAGGDITGGEHSGPAGSGSDRAASTSGRARDESRRVRSTRRRQDAPDLPRQKVAARTIGRSFQAPDGTVYRPSTFLTLTLPSYGRVGPDGAPAAPDRYDYRRAAWDAVHFPALLDRLWQNLRRAVGWNIQYFGAVEPQRRLAPHAHFAIRGAIPRATIRQVIAATYHQVWWPATDAIAYPEHAAQPVWDEHTGGYHDPHTGQALPTYDQALDTLDQQLDADPERQPEHVARFGAQVDIQGVLAGTPTANRKITYLTKYLTKSVAECHRVDTAAAVEHQRRLWHELRYTPCSPRCPNWLRHGIQPRNPRAKMMPGFCRAKVHQLDTLGLGGRRVLVSRQWSGKTLADHRYDQRLWVRRLLAVARGTEDDIDPDTAERIAKARQGGYPAPVAWDLARPGDPDLPDLPRRLLRAISTRIQHRTAIAAARTADPPGDISATRSGNG